MNPQPVTADDIEDLLTRGCMEPTLVRWLDTDEIEVVAGPLFSDISYSNRYRKHQILVTADDLQSMGSWDTEHPTQADFEAFAEYVNDNADNAWVESSDDE